MTCLRSRIVWALLRSAQTLFVCAGSILIFLVAHSATAQERNAYGSAAGLWNGDDWGATNFLEKPKDGIIGTYAVDNGRLYGNLQGRRFIGIWVEDDAAERCNKPSPTANPRMYWGTVKVQFNEDFTAFRGTWGYCGAAMDRTWVGSRIALSGPVQVRHTKEKDYNLVFLVEGASGFVAADGMRVQEGDFFIVEVSFDAPPEQMPLVVDLEWDGADRGLSVTLNRFGGSGTVYRSDPLVMDSKESVTYGVKN